MARRLVLLPVKREATRDTLAEPDLLGVKGIEILQITQDYRDCCKVIADGSPERLAALQDASRAYFAEAWPSPTERERRDQLGDDA